MRAVVVTRYGGPEVLAVVERPDPEPAAGEALVRLDYAGVNFTDVYNRNGLYARSTTYANAPPFVIGREGAGVVERLGEGVRGLAVGARVAWCLELGSYAELACVPAWRLVEVPDGVSMEIATALMLQGCTAHYLSHALFPIEPGHRCLVHAAAGGVGRLLVQMAKLRGAEVFATVGSEDKATIARACGADHVIPYQEVDFAETVRLATGGAGVDVVYDSVGQATFDGSLRALAKRGTLCSFGAASGPVEAVDPLELAEAGSLYFTRPHMADYMRDAAEIGARAAAVFGYLHEGRLNVAIDRVLPLAGAAEAHRALEARATTGKVLLATR